MKTPHKQTCWEIFKNSLKNIENRILKDKRKTSGRSKARQHAEPKGKHNEEYKEEGKKINFLKSTLLYVISFIPSICSFSSVSLLICSIQRNEFHSMFLKSDKLKENTNSSGKRQAAADDDKRSTMEVFYFFFVLYIQINIYINI